jgi:hypothetical protein
MDNNLATIKTNGSLLTVLYSPIPPFHSFPPPTYPTPFYRVHPLPSASSSCVYSQCAVHIVVGSCMKGHFIHAGAFSGPGVLLLLVLVSSSQMISSAVSHSSLTWRRTFPPMTNEHATSKLWTSARSSTTLALPSTCERCPFLPRDQNSENLSRFLVLSTPVL